MNVIRYIKAGRKAADGLFGFQADIIDLIFYLCVLAFSYGAGHPKVGVCLVAIFVVIGLVLAYRNGKIALGE